MDGSGLLMIIVAIALIVGGLVIFTSLDRYSKFFMAIEKLIGSIKYVIYGAGVITAAAGLYVVCTMITSVGVGIGFKPVWLLYAGLGYIILYVLGRIAERVVAHMANMHAQYVERQAAVEEPPA